MTQPSVTALGSSFAVSIHVDASDIAVDAPLDAIYTIIAIGSAPATAGGAQALLFFTRDSAERMAAAIEELRAIRGWVR